MMRPFVLLATRANDEVADAEYAAFCELGGLDPSELVRIRLEQRPMPVLDLDSFSGVLVGGSPFTSTDPQESKSDVQVRVELEIGRFLDEVVERDFPYLGACYGVGTLGVHEGGVIDTTFHEGIGVARVSLTAEGRHDPLLAGVPDAFDAYVGHKEAVRQLPPHAVLLATGEDCPVQMFRIGTNQYATQFHPELTKEGLLQRIAAYDGYGYYEPGEGPALVAAVETSRTPHPPQILRNFVERFSR